MVYCAVNCSVYVVYYTVDCSIDQCVVSYTNYDFSSIISGWHLPGYTFTIFFY